MLANTATSSNTKSVKLVRGEETCPICHGKGYYILDVPPGDPDFGRAIPCVCTLRRQRADQMVSWRNLSHMQALLSEMTFANFRQDGAALSQDRRQNLHHAYQLAFHFAENPEGWLFFMGGYGCGKTHLAAAIANEVWQRGGDALFVVVPDLLDHLRSTFHPDSTVSYDEQFELLRTVPVLILDDFGAQSNTPWANEKLYQIINFRYNAQLPTVVTTNLALEEIDPRIRSRLLDTMLTATHYITAPDYRGGGRGGSDADLNMLSLLRDMTFSSWSERRQEMTDEEATNLRRAFLKAQSFAEDPEGCLLFSGAHGVGKTHLAAAVANLRAERGKLVLFVTVADFLDHLRAAFSPQSQIPYDRRFHDVKTAPFLVLDDFNIEFASPWAKEKLFQLFNYRYLAKLPTIITTVTAVNEMAPRLRSRVMDTHRCAVFGITVPPYFGGWSALDPAKARGKRRR